MATRCLLHQQIMMMLLAPCVALQVPQHQCSRRAALLAFSATFCPQTAHALTKGQAMQQDNAELETSPLIEELKRTHAVL
jgi:hypothetical protein